jgi:K+-sensing histidine kinase KdpD
VELAHVNDRPTALELVPVDVEMLCQQVVQSLADVAKNYQLQLQFSVEPGQRLWSLDRVKMRQMLYHLIYGIIQSARTDGVLRLHGSRKRNHLRFALWLSNPWLDEGMLPMDGIQSFLANESRNETGLEFTLESTPSGGTTGAGIGLLPNRDLEVTPLNPAVLDDRPEHLRFLLSQHLAGLHGGTLTVQNSTESGCRYILTIPLQDMPQDT